MEMKQQPRKIMVNLGLAFLFVLDIERTSPRQLQGLLMVLG
ncbi:unnamed protein product [Prunus armeniaca]|uniref:Uncharacterized protein n=1 Tax=Prunus armeniaca TaxID=36596 RepID=A0A6J5U9K9_PRUAR|nr:unnamed protein product [Prunus armeniaca]